MSPSVPAFLPLYVAPWAWQASSITQRPCLRASALISSMSAHRPEMCTGMIARVLGVMRRSTSRASRLYVRGSMSAKTGTAFWYSTHVAEAMNVNAEVITCSPRSTPAAQMAFCRAVVPLLNATQYFVPTYAAQLRSKSGIASCWPGGRCEFSRLRAAAASSRGENRIGSPRSCSSSAAGIARSPPCMASLLMCVVPCLQEDTRNITKRETAENAEIAKTLSK